MSPNSQNKREQYNCYQGNIADILRTLHNLSDGYFKDTCVSEGVLKTLASRFSSHNRVTGGDIAMAEVQRDIGYFLLLIAQKYDFSQYDGDTRDMRDIFVSIDSLENQTGTHANTVRMIQETEEAINTGGAQPPAKEMLHLRQSEVVSLVKQILSNS